jgi:hypothetical protein
MLNDDSTASQTYELYGPKNYSTAEIAALVDKEIVKHRRHFNIPKRMLKPFALALNKVLWWHTMSADEVEREFIDQVIDPKAKTFADLGIEPADLSSLTFHYLVSFRTQRLICAVCFVTYSIVARVPVFSFLRSGTRDGEGEAGGEEVSACPGRPVNIA